MATSTNSRPRAAKARISNSAAIDSAADARDSAEKNPAAPAAPVSAALSAIERVRLARNPSRPQTLDYVEHLVRDFFEIHGDRRFADDGAIVAGLGFFGRRAGPIVRPPRGPSPPERIPPNFRQPPPQGYPQGAGRFDPARPPGRPP